MRLARQARYRCPLRSKGEKDHDAKAPLRDPFLDNWTPARTKRLGRLRPKASRWLSGMVFYKRTTPLCVECACAGRHRVRTCTSRAPRESLLKPSIRLNLRRGCSRGAFPTSHRVLQPRPRGSSSSMAPNYRSLYHHRMRKSKFPSRDMLPTGHNAAFFTRALPTGGFCLKGKFVR
jgi:hypothetical protein